MIYERLTISVLPRSKLALE